MHYGALPKKTSIKGQPHELSYITPQEAGVLKMLGGSGDMYNGVPSYAPATTTSYANMNPDVSRGYQQAVAGGYRGAGSSGYNNNNDKKPKKQSEQTIMDLLIANNAKARAERAEAARIAAEIEANRIAETNIGSTGQVGDLSDSFYAKASGDENVVSNNSTVQMKDGKVLVSTNVGNTTENTYLDPETYIAMTGNQPPQNVQVRDDVSSLELDRTKPVDTTGFVEDAKAAGSDFLGLLSGDPLGNQEQNYFVPGYGDVMATSAADAFEKARFFKDNPELAASYAKGLGAPDFVTGDTDGDGIMDTYSGGADVRVGDSITDPNFDPNLNPTTAKYYDEYFPAQADKFDADGFVYDDEFFAGSGSFAKEKSVNQSMLDTYGFDYDGTNLDGSCKAGYSKVNGVCTKDKVEEEGGFFTPVVEFFEDLFDGNPPVNDGGSSGGSFSKKRDVYGNPIRLTKGGASWWKMAANWMNPSERIDTYVTVDENDNYITSDNKIVPKDLLETAKLTPTDIKIKTGTEEYQVPYNDMENYTALYTGGINQEPLPVLQEQQVLNVSDPIIKP